MTTPTQCLKIGTRTSELALWQTNHVIARLQAAWPDLECHVEPFVTQGDKTLDKPLPQIGGKGLFTAELESALRDGRIDLAVHSLKDLPVEDAPGLTLGAILNRAPVADGLVARNGWTLATLPPGTVIGTSSNRRRAQILAVRPDLRVESIRGNVQTRVRKVADGLYDATILAEAGLRRLEMTDVVTEWLPLDIMLPAPGQGALAVQCRAADAATLALLAAIEDGAVQTAVTAERAFLQALGGGCSAPIAAYAEINHGKEIFLRGLVGSVDGRALIRVQGSGPDPAELAQRLAAEALAQGASAMLEADQSPISSLQSPLTGKRILVTRSPEQAQAFADKLAALGAEPVVFPVIQFEPLPADLPDPADYDWLIFTSANAVDFFFERLETRDWRLSLVSSLQSPVSSLPKTAAVGSATAFKLATFGVAVDFMPDEFTGEQLAQGLGDLTGQRVLLPRAKIGRPEIVALLRERGAVVDDVALYDTVTAVPTPAALAELDKGVDAITFTSPSSVRNFLQIVESRPQGFLKPLGSKAVVACIGPVTAAQARELGLTVHVTPEDYTIDALIEALMRYWENRD
ncbi:MAG: hydroxymethylbilane synthase [Ardenticatenaceae bacterium]|nr:hydroxymethylbilane synthase [Ardenticatenaceae bacterium]MCB8987399.1 hydroxymethylbilane synthase [Ardenticatenaceae bacterium]